MGCCAVMPSQGDAAGEEREAIGGDGRQNHDKRLRDPSIDIIRGVAVVIMLSVSDISSHFGMLNVPKANLAGVIKKGPAEPFLRVSQEMADHSFRLDGDKYMVRSPHRYSL